MVDRSWAQHNFLSFFSLTSFSKSFFIVLLSLIEFNVNFRDYLGPYMLSIYVTQILLNLQCIDFLTKLVTFLSWNRVCFHCSPFRWHPNFQSVIITQPSMYWFFCFISDLSLSQWITNTFWQHHRECSTMGHMGHGSSIQWVMGHSKWPIAYPDSHGPAPANVGLFLSLLGNVTHNALYLGLL